MTAEAKPTLDDLSAAVTASDGTIPGVVLEAFLPQPATHLGQRLVPLTAGHDLVLAHIDHPLASGKEWSDLDVLMALFVFSRSSLVLFSMISDETFEAEFFQFLEGIPTNDVKKLGHDMAYHWTKSRSTALAMEGDHPAQKKTAVSGGGSAPSPLHARSSGGVLKRLCTKFRSRKSSR